jgi:hypothetical protein
MLCEAGLAYQVGTSISLQCSAGTEQSLIRSKHLVRAFHQGLSETGHVEGRNVAIEYR